MTPVPVVVIPVYNHGASLRGVVLRALEQCPRVLVVDDGSTDGGAGTLAGLPVRIVRLARNSGKGAALLAGARAAREQGATHMLTLDADGQHYPEDIPRMLHAVAAHPRAFIVGRRDFNVPHVPRASRFGRAFSAFWMRVQTGVAVSDMQSGFRAYPLRELARLALSETGYAFEIEVLVRAAWAGCAICEVDVRVCYPPPSCRISHFRAFRDNARICLLNTRLTLRALLPTAGLRWHLGSRLQYGVFACLVRCRLVWLARALLAVVVLYYTLLPGVRQRCAAYLCRRFPGDGGLLRCLRTYRLYLNFGAVLLDRMVAGITGRFSLEPLPAATRALLSAAGRHARGCIVLAAHVGAWQTGLAGLEACRTPVHMLEQRMDGDVDKHYFQRGRGRPLHIIDANDAVGSLVAAAAALRRGEIVCLMGDRLPEGAHAEQGVDVPLLGGTVRLPVTAYALASLTGAELLLLFTVRKAGRASIAFAERLAVPAGLPRRNPAAFLPYARRFARGMELVVERYPYQFFNFYDMWR